MIDEYLVGMSLLRYFNSRNNPEVRGTFEDSGYLIYHETLNCKIKVDKKHLEEIDFFIMSYLEVADGALGTDMFLTCVVGDFIDTIDEIKNKRNEFSVKLMLLELKK